MKVCQSTSLLNSLKVTSATGRWVYNNTGRFNTFVVKSTNWGSEYRSLIFEGEDPFCAPWLLQAALGTRAQLFAMGLKNAGWGPATVLRAEITKINSNLSPQPSLELQAFNRHWSSNMIISDNSASAIVV